MPKDTPTDRTVFVVDDDPNFRKSVCQLLESVKLDVKSFASVADFLAFYSNQPGCLVLDVRMPGMSGMELQKKLSDEDTVLPVIFITAHAEVPIAVEAMRRGAVDFVQKPFSPHQFLERIQQALEKDTLQRQEQALHEEIQQHLESLSPRQREVMELLLNGENAKSIAVQLGISSKTVDFHRRHLMEKLQVDNLLELVRLVEPR